MGSSISKGETLIDTVKNIIAMKVDMIIIRHPSPGVAEFLTKHKLVYQRWGRNSRTSNSRFTDTFSINEKLGSVIIKGSLF